MSIKRKTPQFHKFNTDNQLNRDPPSWFVECDRDQAEDILRRYADANKGNVLMRIGSKGNYAISARVVTSSGEPKISHFVIEPTKVGLFKLQVDNKPPPMECLSEVMEYYLRNSWFQSSMPINFLSATQHPVPQPGSRKNSTSGDYKTPNPLKHDYQNMNGRPVESRHPILDDYAKQDGLRDQGVIDKPGYFNKEGCNQDAGRSQPLNDTIGYFNRAHQFTRQNSVPVGSCCDDDGVYLIRPGGAPDYINVPKGALPPSIEENDGLYLAMDRNPMSQVLKRDYVNIPKDTKAKSKTLTKGQSFDSHMDRKSYEAVGDDIPTMRAPPPPPPR